MIKYSAEAASHCSRYQQGRLGAVSALYQINAVDIRSMLDEELHSVEVAIVRASDQRGLLHLWHSSASSFTWYKDDCRG